MFGRFLTNKTGGTAVEYVLIAALVAAAVVSVITALGTSVSGYFDAAKINSSRTVESQRR